MSELCGEMLDGAITWNDLTASDGLFSDLIQVHDHCVGVQRLRGW